MTSAGEKMGVGCSEAIRSKDGRIRRYVYRSDPFNPKSYVEVNDEHGRVISRTYGWTKDKNGSYVCEYRTPRDIEPVSKLVNMDLKHSESFLTVFDELGKKVAVIFGDDPFHDKSHEIIRDTRGRIVSVTYARNPKHPESYKAKFINVGGRRRVSSIIFSENPKASRSVVYEYDKNGRLVSCLVQQDPKNELSFIQKFDDDGKLLLRMIGGNPMNEGSFGDAPGPVFEPDYEVRELSAGAEFGGGRLRRYRLHKGPNGGVFGRLCGSDGKDT